MPNSLSDNILRLTALKKAQGRRPAGERRLTPLEPFGANPGNLTGWTYVPPSLAPGKPLVVVLHGCTQSAADYDQGSGWSQLAERFGFALLFPEQQRVNNGNLCFNWFEAGDTRRGAGEPASVAAMIDAVVAAHAIDTGRIFVTGLSAGGAMTSVMLATYPELFAGGAIIAGLPYGAATSVSEALQLMARPAGADQARLTAHVRAASDFDGPWPKVSIWHGTADHVVKAANGDASTLQWLGVHGLAQAPDAVEIVDGARRAVWYDADRRPCIEQFSVTGMGHGTPVGIEGPEACGVPGPHMLAASISSTYRIASFWGLIDEAASDAPSLDTGAAAKALPPVMPVAPRLPAQAAEGPGDVIERALRAAGLM